MCISALNGCWQVFGAVKTFDLKEGGGETAVTKANRKEYVDLYVRWLLVESVKGQYGPFERYVCVRDDGRVGRYEIDLIILVFCFSASFIYRRFFSSFFFPSFFVVFCSFTSIYFRFAFSFSSVQVFVSAGSILGF